MKGVAPFTPTLVTPDQALRYERQAQELLGDTLREFDAHVAACKSGENPLHDKWHWKALKMHESLDVYKERQPTHPALNVIPSKMSFETMSSHSFDSVIDQPVKPAQAVAMAAFTPEMPLSASSEAVTGSSSIASVVITGHISGSLNDAMYGVVATDTAELQLRLRYMADAAVLDTAMINCIHKPSADEPFRFLGLQWLVRGEPSRKKTSSRHSRDFVLLVASGVVQHKVAATAEIQEIGYNLYQSVDIQDCEGLETPKLTRGWLSTCLLFAPIQNSQNHMSVFSRGFADFKGKMQDHQATSMMATLMLAGATQATTCGQHKKLSWLLSSKGAAEEFRQMQPKSEASLKCCGICERKFGILSSVASCNLCLVSICSRCRISRDLCFVKRPSNITQHRNQSEDQDATIQVQRRVAVFCKNCKVTASNLDARVMVRRQVEAGKKQRDDNSKVCRISGGKTTFLDTPGDLKLESSDPLIALSLSSFQDRDSINEETRLELTSYKHRLQHQHQYAGEEPELSCIRLSAPDMESSQAELVRRMQELQMKSESVYQLTSQMNVGMRYQHIYPSNSSAFISELD